MPRQQCQRDLSKAACSAIYLADVFRTCMWYVEYMSNKGEHMIIEQAAFFGDAGMSCAGPARTWWRSLRRSLSLRVNL